MELEIYCDGGARNNPGPAGVGVVIAGEHKISKYIGTATNNQAEYMAVVAALEWLADNQHNLGEKPEKISVHLDSRLVVNQLNGRFKVKNANLREMLLKVRGLENQIDIPVTYHLVPREENREADRLVNRALDELNG